jgi:hypothetical protein
MQVHQFFFVSKSHMQATPHLHYIGTASLQHNSSPDCTRVSSRGHWNAVEVLDIVWTDRRHVFAADAGKSNSAIAQSHDVTLKLWLNTKTDEAYVRHHAAFFQTDITSKTHEPVTSSYRNSTFSICGYPDVESTAQLQRGHQHRFLHALKLLR